jgi:8-oxo-dGTP pyrophosphatase MutT (NUDIX family)
MTNFQDFLALVPKLIQLPLPAEAAHHKMAPSERIQFLENLDIDALNPKIAAVMLLLYPKNNITHLVLILRNSYAGVHSAQIAFPGGKFEQSDANYQLTALRETQEEIGIHIDKIEIIREFTSLYIPPSNFKVHPFLGICKEEIEFILDPFEVADIIELSVTDLFDEELQISTKVKTSYNQTLETPAYKIKNHIVWGATAMILSELKEVLKKV